MITKMITRQHKTLNNKTEMRPMILAAWLGLCQSMHHQYSDNRKARDTTREREGVPVPQHVTAQPDQRNYEPDYKPRDREAQVVLVRILSGRLDHMNRLHIGREARSRLRHVHHLRLRCRALDAELRSRRELGELRLSSSYRPIGRQGISHGHCERVGTRLM